MTVMQSFRMALKSISAKKMRSFLTMLGIIIGVASVVILVSVIQAQNKKSLEYLESQGTNKLTVSAYRWTGGDISRDLYDYCLGLSDLVVGVTPEVHLYNDGLSVKYGTHTVSATAEDWRKSGQFILGSDQYGLCNNYKLSAGRDLTRMDIDNYQNVCVLGGGVAETLFNLVNPVGKSVTILGTPYTVVGVYQKKNVDNWPELDNLILLPYSLNRTLGNNQTISEYSVKAVSASAADVAAIRIQGYLSALIPESSGYSHVQNNNQSMDSMDEMLMAQSLVLGGIAGISLLVGGIGIMNIMLVTVTERTREIGIRKAIGASRRSIILQFLIEASVICAIGGIIGILLGFLGTLIAAKLLLKMLFLPGEGITIGAFAFSVVLGIIFGLYPAIKASGLQPVEALRAE
ncbi:MAG: ABC transporter permease [Oscillospiraceae bacterium]|nr:ABC transporter permease [Oscillospiraceae bacterium]